MKKTWILVTVIVAFIFIVSFVGYRVIMENNKEKSKEIEQREYEETLELVKDINQNSDFGGLELLKFSDKTGGNQQSHGAFDIQPDFAEEAKEGVEGMYFRYPCDNNDHRLSNISITKMPYHIYGISIGQNLNDAAAVLEEKGFNEFETDSYDYADFVLYRQHHVSVNFKVSKDTRVINSITVSVYDKEDDTVY